MDERFGVGMTAKVLRGSKDKKIMSFRLHKISTYGILSRYTERELTEIINFLIAERILGTEEGRFPTLKLNKHSVEALKGERPVWTFTAPIPTSEETDYNEELFNILRAHRKRIANKKNVPQYVLFSDATLRDLSRYFPATNEDMLEIKGIGERKYEQYGEVFMTAIQDWKNDNPDVKSKVRISDAVSVGMKPRRQRNNDDEPSHIVSYQMFQSGKSIKDIAVIREMKQQTIESHIFKAYKEGYPIVWDIFFNDEEEVAVLAAREEIDEPKLRPLKEALPDGYDYTKIKAVLVKNELM